MKILLSTYTMLFLLQGAERAPWIYLSRLDYWDVPK
jgi:hypothetical protein